jgi:hypothetical protein
MRQHMPGGGGRKSPAGAAVGRTFALAITVVVAFSCVAASSALAAQPEWLLGGKALTEKHAIEWKNQTITLEYGGSEPYSFEVTCKTSGEGNVYPLGLEEEVFGLGAKVALTKTTYSCERPRIGLCTSVKLEGGNRSTNLSSEGSQVLLGKGFFLVYLKCEAGPEKVIDECSVNVKTPVTNESTGVLATLEGKNVSCAETPSGSSWLHGKITFVATGSSKLSVS